MSRCKNCGKELNNDNEYCKNCNQKKRTYRHYAKEILEDLKESYRDKSEDNKQPFFHHLT